MKASHAIQPHDIAILLKLVAHPNKEWRQIELAYEMDISQGEIAKSLKRLRKVKLLLDKKPVKSQVKEFILHSLKFIFPGEVGAITKGIPTSISYSDVKKNIVTHDTVEHRYVLPSSHGNMLGQAVEPLYKKLPNALVKDEKLYRMIANLDMLRIGRARERNLAVKYFEKELA